MSEFENIKFRFSQVAASHPFVGTLDWKGNGFGFVSSSQIDLSVFVHAKRKLGTKMLETRI